MNWWARAALALVGFLLGSGCERGWCDGPIASCFPDMAKPSTMDPGNPVDMTGPKPSCTPAMWENGATARPECTIVTTPVKSSDTINLNISKSTGDICYALTYFIRAKNPKLLYKTTTDNMPKALDYPTGADSAAAFGGFVCIKIKNLSEIAANVGGLSNSFFEVFLNPDSSCDPGTCKPCDPGKCKP